MADEVVAAVTTFRSWTYSPLARRRRGTTFSLAPARTRVSERGAEDRELACRPGVFSISLTGRNVGWRPDVSLRTVAYQSLPASSLFSADLSGERERLS